MVHRPVHVRRNSHDYGEAEWEEDVHGAVGVDLGRVAKEGDGGDKTKDRDSDKSLIIFVANYKYLLDTMVVMGDD